MTSNPDHRLPSGAEGRSLPSWARRAILSLLGGIAALYYLRGLLEALRPLILVLLVAFFLSFALEPAVNRLERAGLRRGMGTALTMVVLVAGMGGVPGRTWRRGCQGASQAGQQALSGHRSGAGLSRCPL